MGGFGRLASWTTIISASHYIQWQKQLETAISLSGRYCVIALAPGILPYFGASKSTIALENFPRCIHFEENMAVSREQSQLQLETGLALCGVFAEMSPS